MNYPQSSLLEVALPSDGILKIIFNRPKKKNALNYEMKKLFPEILSIAAKDPEVKVVAVSGQGDYFTSGNDFSSVGRELDEYPPEEAAEISMKMFKNFMDTLIEFPKVLVAILNGPAVGMGVTMLPHFDYVVASNLATFHTPFTALGLIPEGCSSYYFPRMMGVAKASEMLLFGKKISAEEALERNLVSVVIPSDKIESAWEKVKEIAALPIGSLMASKRLIRSNHLVRHLKEINTAETDALRIRSQSEEFYEILQKKFLRRSKL